MKIRIIAITALIIGSLYGCGNDSDTTASSYTPAPITPRPTFDASHYRTKEEITAKQDEDFVIATVGVDTSGPYPAKTDEYTTIVVEDPNETPRFTVSSSSGTSRRTSSSSYTSTPSTTTNRNNSTLNTNSSTIIDIDDAVYDEPETTPAPVITPRPAYSVPEGFSSKNYPYSIYSFDGRTYLGKVTMDTDDFDSIWNVNGEYGSPNGTNSIYNTYGIYGSSNSMFSAFNDYATAPPKIYDSKGNMVGLLSSNLIHTNGISPEELKSYVEKNGL